ncbi:MAG: Glu-tRNA(Gln) amidotransferase subunit GatD, partial [Promethearchaeota archaeon]
MSEKLKGYKGEGKELLEKYNLNIWDIIQIKTEKTSYEGIILPRSEYSAENFINIKLENNYNVGIKVSEIQEIKK